MKVLHLISGGDTGGAKTHVLSLIKELSRHISVTVVCFMEGDFYREGQELGLDIRLIPQKRRYNLRVIRRLRSIISEEGFDVLHCHGARANFLAALLKRCVRIPSITTMHSDYKLDFQDSFYKNFFYTALNSWALKSFDYYIAVSDSFKDMLVSRGFPAESIYVVYNGIDFGAPLNLTSREAFLKRLNIDIPGDARIVGLMARLHPVKGHDMFLSGASLVLEEMPDTYFLVAGEGEEKKKLLEMRRSLGLQDRVLFTGYIDRPDEFINILDINILTSHSESFPLVLLEGARQKKPTVSSDVGGIGCLIREGETGLLFPAGDSSVFASQLLRLLRDEDLARSLGENLYSHARQNFSLERLGEDHCGIYETILNK